MECPSCRYVSKEDAPKFCSECGQKLPPAAAAPDSENHPRVTSAPEGEMECGLELKDEGDPQGTAPEGEMECGLELKDEGDPQGTAPEGEMECGLELKDEGDPQGTAPEGEMECGLELKDEGDPQGTAPEGEMECGLELKDEGSSNDWQETPAQPCSDVSWSKHKRKRQRRKSRKSQNSTAAPGLDSLSPTLSLPCSLDSLEDPGLRDAAPARSRAPQAVSPPVTEPPEAGGRRGSQGQTAGAATGGKSPSSPAPQDQAPGETFPEEKDQDTPSPTQGRSLPQEGAGPAAAASKSPMKEDAARECPLPGPPGGRSEPKKEPQTVAPASGAVDAAAKPANSGKGAEKEVKNKTQKPKQPPASGPVSREHRQEAEPKEKTAVPGEKAKPEDQKKPEGSNRNDAAATKNEKDQRNQRAGTQELKESPLSPGAGAMVYFHTIISKDFKFDHAHHKMFVRGGEELGKPPWRLDVCEMHFSKDVGQHGFLMEGSMVISKQHLNKHIPYKYVVSRPKEWEYEFIYKHQQGQEHVNRCLYVRSSLLSSGDWHQYDDICMKPPGKFKAFVNHFTDSKRKEVVKGKQAAACVMLDSMFSILQAWNAINVRSFFAQFDQFYAVARVPMVYEGKAQPWTDLLYGEKEVKTHLWDYLKKKMAPFLERREVRWPENWPVRSPVRMGLIVLHLVGKLQLPLSECEPAWLCDLLCANASSPDEFHSDLSHILGASQRWQEYLVNLCQVSMDEKIDLWVGTLPVLHCCMGLSPRGRDVGTLSEDTWAALEGISFSEFREQRSDQKQLLQVMGRKKHLLEVDEDLFRSWFSLVPLGGLVHYMEESCDYLVRFPTRVLDCLLGTCYRLQGLQEISYRNREDVENTCKMLLHLLDMHQGSVSQELLVPSFLAVGSRLHAALCSRTKDPGFYELPALSAEIVCRILTLKPLVDSARGQGGDTGENSVGTMFQETLRTTRTWLQRTFQKRMFQSSLDSVQFTYSPEIQAWRRLVDIDFPKEFGWKKSLLGDLEGRLKQEKPHAQISVFCSADWGAAGPGDSVSKCFENCVIEAVSSACQARTSVLEGLSCSNWRRFGTLVSTVITKSWPRCHGEAVRDAGQVLKHLLTSPDIKQLFKLCGTDEKVLAHITEEGKELMATADTVFMNVTAGLQSGAIAVGQLELIHSHARRFLDIWELKRESLSPQERKHDMRKLLDYRVEMLMFLKDEKKYVDSLLKLCDGVKHLVQVDFGEIAERHLEDLGRKPLSKAVTLKLLATGSGVMGMTHYNLSPEVRDMAEKTDVLKDSHVFRVFWEEAAQGLSQTGEDEGEGARTLAPADAYEELYCPCFHKFSRLYEDLKSGEVTFEEVDAVFKVFENQYDLLAAELRVMCTLDPRAPQDWVPERVGQIREYHHLHQAASAADVLLKVKENLGLTGDFRVLHALLRLTDDLEGFRHEQLQQISQQLIDARKLLQGIDQPRYLCLKELSLRTEFVTWVREALGGITELKVFVDLASISAGENDIDVDRVACFHDAVQGYSSLLYELDPGADFREFMNHLKELWKALENDQHLPSKLRDSARNLEWLKTVKESHGSVELSSLSLATAINSRGIYIIRAPASGQISPDTVLHLVLPESHGDPEDRRVYSLEELKELLNKLMLMSGKKDHNSTEVELFSEVFCSVQRLLQCFITLHAAGNVLFRAWTAEVRCCPRDGVSVRMDFGLELLSPLAGGGPVGPLLEAVCKQMEGFLGRWQSFVESKRAEHVHLNYYTAEQLVHLSEQLSRQPPSEATLTLLSFVKRGCTARDVAEACQQLGAAAGGPGSTTAGALPLMLFCESALGDKLRVVMEQSLEGMHALLPHRLGLDSLGRFLAQLASAGGPPVTRQLPRGLQAGRPNLLVCERSEVLLAGLAVYMQSPEQPLPTYDEALLCTPATSFEDVALLLRRCLAPGSRGHRVYSLLFADRLGYEVACRAEALFLSLCTQPHREDYQLVLVCDAEREHCYLPSAFSHHKVPVTPQVPLEAAQAYLAWHFRVPEETAASAAAVFQDRMCVGIVASQRAGVGKSLYVKRLHKTLKRKFNRTKVPLKIIRLIDPQVDENQVLASLLPFLDARYHSRPVLFHFDVTSSVQRGVWTFLFKLLVLQYLMDVNGRVWLRNPCHLYVVEILDKQLVPPRPASKLRVRAPPFGFLDIFPRVTCRSPKEVMELELRPQGGGAEPGVDPGMDQGKFSSETFQRPFQYLKRFFQKQDLDGFRYRGQVEGTPGECVQHLLLYCGLVDPSWSELRNFARFLNYQLRDCEASLFCDPRIVGDTLRGFKTFVVSFMILMARDFATPTLQTSDQSPGKHLVPMDGVREEDLAPFSLRKRWESKPHPYVFFNRDHTSMTFIGFHLQPNTNGGWDVVDRVSQAVIQRDVMTHELYRALLLQRVPFNVDFDALPRHEKLERLCLALGIEWPIDPDDTYELTTDNMLKILAIEMRFRCGIPVIIMGETGCGKTRLVRFLSDLRRGSAQAQTLQLVKVHGGTTADAIHAQVRRAQALAVSNTRAWQLDTILFFDEANTTEAVSCIKEVLCDRTAGGRPLQKGSGLHVIAACNPYRRHSQRMISRLEAAGLGYRVSAEDTADRLGSVPLRQLVYRVHALPPSLIPLVWDFGQLNDTAEKLYIQQIVQRLVADAAMDPGVTVAITSVLSASQGFMRRRDNECSFVSLRDVERCVRVFRWFYDRSGVLLPKLESFLRASGAGRGSCFDRDPVFWSLVLALGVSYHASLEKQESYRRAVCRFLPEPYNDSRAVLDEITWAQDLFLDRVALRKTIAKNLALKENIFMMVVCIELRIPLFLVGKPGSSKSLAKTIVADAMQGPAAPSDLFRGLKQVHLVSFQCSPHSTPQGIIGTFRQCARFQQGRDLRHYVSVVVLDEVGLAEDSPKMPLKTLHPLLEDGCVEDDPAPHKKVGFIGISNWALDPAKMNRGIAVFRGSPDARELVASARGICSSEPLVLERVQGYFTPFARAYETVCRRQDKEFFGLRDYYSLIKMVFASAKASRRRPSPGEIARAVLRNFSGKDDIRALDVFAASLPELSASEDVGTLQLIRQNVRAAGDPDEPECRYLLVLTRNYAALPILQQALFGGGPQPEILFGSSFPRDQEYAQICRNINRVKICMETGRTVVLLNLQNLYESLYDALNQYYVYLGGQKYVDLGLGTHRVKCRVHPDFRLIVIEEKDVVYERFPVPLVNRLEKHYLDMHSVLDPWQRGVVEALQAWVHSFAAVRAEPFMPGHQYSPADVFVGYHSDSCAVAVLQVLERRGAAAPGPGLPQEVLAEAQRLLLACASPDAMVRLGGSALSLSEARALARAYRDRRRHDSFADFLRADLQTAGPERRAAFTEVTTFSRLLTTHDCEMLEAEVKGRAPRPTILSLQQFDTEYSFLKEVRNCFANTAPCKILIVQTEFEDAVHSAQLIASAKYSALNEINKLEEPQGCVFIYFITKLSRMESGTSYVGFHGGLWQSVHIDDLRRSSVMVSDVTKLQEVTISQLFSPDDTPESEGTQGAEGGHQEAMETEPEEPGDAPEVDTDMECSGPKESEACEPGRSRMQALDTSSLLRSCIQSAVAMLRDQAPGPQCGVRRVELLLGLFSEDGGEGRASFLGVAKARLHELLRQQEDQAFGMKQWVVREASNPDALQEAGTFRHTLWKRVQGVVTPLLASMVSIIDRDGNLELLTSPESPSWAKDLWMFIFRDAKLLNIPLVAGDTRSKPEMSYVLVPSHLSEGVHNSVPFSWRLRDYLDELWLQAQYITETEGLSEKLVDIFQQTPLGRFLAELSVRQQRELLHCYLRDFLLLTMRVPPGDQLQFLQMALWSCINELRAGDPLEGLSLPWVHLAYQHFRLRLQNFSRILTIYPRILGSLTQALQSHNLAGREMALDAFAALACTELLTRDLLQPSPQAWLQAVKTLSVPLEVLCSERYLPGPGSMARALVGEVRTHWNRLLSVALFVEHVLLGTERQMPELRELLTRHVLSLDRRLRENSDLKTHGPFSAVMTTLCECKDQASRTFSRFGVRPCPICLGDAQDPVRLPCDHVFCLGCIRSSWLTPGQVRCPYCLTDLPHGFSPEVSPESRDAIEKHACFRQMCTRFFVDLVSTMCFRDSRPPHKDVVDTLLSLLFVRKELLRDAPQRHHEHTKSLSPFDDVVDKTPVIRSVVLKLLLKYSFHEVRDYIQDYLSQLEKKEFMAEDKTDLYVLFTSCLEDSIYEKNSAFSASDERKYLRDEAHFLQTYPPARGRPPTNEASVEYLWDVARIRLCLDRASDLLPGLQDGTAGAEEQHYLQQIERFCTQVGSDWYRVYLVRKLTSQHGMEFVQSLTQPGHPARWVFPPDALTLQKDQPSQIDRYLVHGLDYKAIRDTVGKAILGHEPLAIGTALQACRNAHTQQAVRVLLALFREVATLYRSHNASLHPKPEQCEAVNEVIRESKVLPPDAERFATSLVTNELPLLRAGPGDGGLEGTVAEMAVHAAAILLCGQNEVLGPLRNLAFFPGSMAHAFLPTMPEDLLAQARAWEGLNTVRWYTCPNGHPCTVGECGMPVQQSTCVDCGALVGGINHRPNPGFCVIYSNEDRTQTGHVLGLPPPRGEAVVSDRGLSPVVFLLLRLLTHLAMLLGAAQDPQALANIIKPPVRDPRQFLQQHIQRDVERLTKMLGRSADDTVSTVHRVLCSLQERRPLHSQSFDANWSSKEKRNCWEKVVESIILPELKRLDETLLTVNALISQDERVSSSPVARIVFGDPVAFLPRLPRGGVVHSSKMWSWRTRVSVEHLQHVAEQKDGRDTVPVLWRFLQREAELRLVRFLPEILALQRDLVKRFQTASEADYQSLRGFISSHSSDGLRQLFHDRITVFLSTWNRLRRSLETNGDIKLPKEYCSADLDLDSDFEVVLPRRQGLGLCSTALVSYLVNLHNEMVYTVEKFSKDDSSYSVDISEVTELHVISYELERDLTPLILSNCQYRVEHGGRSLQEFDLEKIQRQLCSRFLQGKPRLTLRGLPTLVFRRDRNYEHLFAAIRSKMPQSPLPNTTISAISGQLQSYSDACEALSVIEVTLGFLSTAGEDPNMDLNVYIQDKLLMGDQTEQVVKAFHRCQLRHAIALWQLLAAHRSEQLLRLRKEPFREISAKYKVALSPENTKLLSTFLNQSSVDAFLRELHEMMTLKLKNPKAQEDFKPHWSLRDTLVSYMETKESDILPEVESQLPEEILLSSCVPVWEMAALLKRDRQTR